MGTSQVENKTVKGTGKGPSSKGQAPTLFAMDLSMALGKIMDILFSDSISYISLCNWQVAAGVANSCSSVEWKVTHW